MNKYSLDPAKIKDEKEIQESINALIDENRSFVFRAGAGVGKTYALIETTKHALEKMSATFDITNEKIRIITFTNAATKEIVERIGQNNNIVCSTIHEFAWEIISKFPKELLQIHLEQIKKEIEDKKIKMNYSLFDNYIKDMDSRKINEYVSNPKFYDLAGASEIRSFFNFSFGDANKFYTAFKAFISKQKLEATQNKIEKYIQENHIRIDKEFLIKYDINSNIKNLNKMRIDHDLLLSYFFTMVTDFPLVHKVISAKYPLLFVDEYQDTDCRIVDSIMEVLIDNKCKILLGFFGDESQNIYGTDNSLINDSINNNSLKYVYKQYNRRCSEQVIKVGNKFNHQFLQESIYTNHNDGRIEIIDAHSLDLQSVIEQIKGYGRVDCLILKNRTIADKIGIGDIYNFYQNTKEYKGINYENLNTELLHHDIDKLGPSQRIVFSMIRIYKNCCDDDCNLDNLFDLGYNLHFDEIRRIIVLIKDLKEKILEDTDLGTFMNMLFSIIDADSSSAKSVRKKAFGVEYTLSDIKQFITEKVTSENEGSFFSLKIMDFFKWYSFIIDKQETSLRFHTYHNTKGLEFENVAIVIEDKFRKNNDIRDFLLSCKQAILENDYSKVESNGNFRNLFYVAVTRSIKNLFIINMSSVSNDDLKVIFS